MKTKYLIVIIALVGTYSLEAQPISNDTVICIVDTTESYVEFRENPFKEKNENYHWQVTIKGNYYNHISHDASFAMTVFSTDFRNEEWIKEPFIITIPIKGMKEKFIVVTDNWINEQDDLYEIKERVGSFPNHKYNFIVFKQDIENGMSGKVKAHQVLAGHNEIQY